MSMPFKAAQLFCFLFAVLISPIALLGAVQVLSCCATAPYIISGTQIEQEIARVSFEKYDVVALQPMLVSCSDDDCIKQSEIFLIEKVSPGFVRRQHLDWLHEKRPSIRRVDSSHAQWINHSVTFSIADGTSTMEDLVK